MKEFGETHRNPAIAPTSQQLYLSSVLDGSHAIEIRLRENRAELETRLRIQEADAQQQRRKDTILFSVTLTFVLLLALVCIAVILLPNSSAPSLSWAREILTSLAVGVGGYLFGRSNSKK